MLLFHRGDGQGAEVMPESGFLSGGGFGILPVTTGARVAAPASAGPPLATEGGPSAPPQDVCSSDGLLIYQNFAWRVRSLEDQSTPCISSVTEDTSWIYKSGQRIYVGPFPIDLGNIDGQITTITSPSFVGESWGNWLADAGTSTLKGAAQANRPGAWRFANAFNNPGRWHLFSKLPRVVGARQDYYDDGTPSGAPFTSTELAAETGCFDQVIAANNPTLCQTPGQPITFAPIKAEYASGGHALHPTKAWFITDNDGHRATAVQYEGDTITYFYYSLAQWLAAWSPRFLYDGLWSRVDYNYLKPRNTVIFNRNQDVPPLARFKFPNINTKGQDDWGMWISLGPASGNLRGSSQAPTEGDWDTEIDQPSSHVMQIAFGPMPQEDWWDDFIDFLIWIPTSLEKVLYDIGAWLASVLCDVSKMQASTGLVKDPATKAEMQAAFYVANAGCSSPPPPPNCAAVPTAPGCAVPQPALVKPWWQKWWIWGIGVAAVSVVILSSSKKSTTPIP